MSDYTPSWLARATEQREKALRQRPAISAVERANEERDEREQIKASHRRAAELAREKQTAASEHEIDAQRRREALRRSREEDLQRLRSLAAEELARAERELRARESARIRQIKRNLSKANRKRIRRAELLNRKEGFAELLERPPAPLIGMKIDAFLKLVQGFGPARVNSLLNWVGVPRHATIRRDSEDMLNVAFELGRWEAAVRDGTKRPQWFPEVKRRPGDALLRAKEEERQRVEQEIFLRRREQIRLLYLDDMEHSGGCYLSLPDLAGQFERQEDVQEAIDSWESDDYPLLFKATANYGRESFPLPSARIPPWEIAEGLWD